MADGHPNFCKVCVKFRVRKDYYENHDKKCEYGKKRNRDPERIQKTRIYNIRARLRNPQKYKARNKLNNALRDGKIKKTNCIMCGSDQDVEAHHTDYAKALVAQWLCRKCHRQERHNQIAAPF